MEIKLPIHKNNRIWDRITKKFYDYKIIYILWTDRKWKLKWQELPSLALNK